MSDARQEWERRPWAHVMMDVAHAISRRSKDPSTQVGAVVTSRASIALGMGYNGAPAGTAAPMTGSDRLLWAIHAEENALYKALVMAGAPREGRPLEGGILYCTHRPCARCLARAAHLGITVLWYAADTLRPEQAFEAMRTANQVKLHPELLHGWRAGA